MGPKSDATATIPGLNTTANPNRLIPFQNKSASRMPIKTKELPRSGSNIINAMGDIPMANAIKISFKLSKSVSARERKLERKRIVASFANSAGWKLKPPNAIQLLAPPIFRPITKTTKSKRIEKIYEGRAASLNVCAGIE